MTVQDNYPLLTIDDKVRIRIPELAVVAADIEIGNPQPEAIGEYLNGGWASLCADVADTNYKSLPRISAWRDALRAAGVSLKKYPPSIEAIAARARKQGYPFTVCPIVDVYNALSMRLTLPVGAYDREALNGGLTIRLSEGGEKFVELGSRKLTRTLPEEIVYSDGKHVLTRHLLWRQSDHAKINKGTRRFTLVCEVLDSMGSDLPDKVMSSIMDVFERLLDAEVHSLRLFR